MESKPSLKDAGKKHAVTITVGVAITVIGGVLLLLATGVIGGTRSEPLIVETAQPDPPDPPSNFMEAVAQRGIWESKPLLVDRRPPSDEPLVPLKVGILDLKVSSARELVESPERFTRRPAIFVGKVVEQQDISTPHLEHEYRLVGRERAYDLYVAGSRYGYARTGRPALVVGTLVGVGPTRDFDGGRHRSAYIDARDLSDVIETIEKGNLIGSGAVAKALYELGAVRCFDPSRTKGQFFCVAR